MIKRGCILLKIDMCVIILFNLKTTLHYCAIVQLFNCALCTKEVKFHAPERESSYPYFVQTYDVSYGAV